ncbi:uncharacterized protein LOC120104711 [Phoenix dactylifera]|uniref:Uncharacterized protein LOC120104711 n=1 Tax=Phoenix dactylifera TaxID=42345 RepID=A0A8B8ZDR0_PHODC|nr:uncharacterized protein LOC120104711 [Phoenix dactylifera]
MHGFDRSYPDGLRPYDGGAADAGGRGLEIVSGKAYSAGQTSICRLPPPPGARWRAVGGGGTLTSSTTSLSSGPAPWWAADAEAKRRRRVARYKIYAVQGKVKASIRKTFRWVKALVRGW